MTPKKYKLWRHAKYFGIKLSTTYKRPKGKHSNIVNDLESRLKNSATYYTQVVKEEQFKTIKGEDGEIDNYAINKPDIKKYLLLFEVKTTDTYKNKSKAYQQLEKSREHFKNIYNIDKVFMFYVHGMSGKSKEYKINWYKPKEK